MESRRRSTLFLIELLIVIFVFAVCAAVCVKIFVYSYELANQSKDLKHAISVSESGAECYKAYINDFHKMAKVLGGVTVEESDNIKGIIVYFDQEWKQSAQNQAEYEMLITKTGQTDKASPVLTSELIIRKVSGDEVLSFTIAARGSIK